MQVPVSQVLLRAVRPARRSVTYQFFSLPFCTPKEKQYKIEGLGEVLEGDRLVNTPYSIKFRVDKDNDVLCSIELNQKDLQKFRTAVKNDYYFQARPWMGCGPMGWPMGQWAAGMPALAEGYGYKRGLGWGKRFGHFQARPWMGCGRASSG